MHALKRMMITNDPGIAMHLEECGVERIFIDMETLGKDARQGGFDTHKAAHTFKDIENVARAISSAEIMVRLNPLHVNTFDEVEKAIDSGAKRLMLPMFDCKRDVEHFKELVKGRVPVTFLCETPSSLVKIYDWSSIVEPGFDEVHFGLNDLCLAMKLDFLFEIVAARMLDHPAEVLRARSISWGFGGIATLDEGSVPAKSIIGEHVRLGSRWVILSRSFHKNAKNVSELKERVNIRQELERIARCEADFCSMKPTELLANHKHLAEKIFLISNHMNS